MHKFKKYNFRHGGAFFDELSKTVLHIANDDAIRRDAYCKLYLKALVSFSALISGWCILIFASPNFWMSMSSLALITFGLVGVSLSVQHDANHRAYFRSKTANQILGWSLDCCLGLSSYVWRTKHNIAHHSYTNITEFDDDISQSPLAAFSPHAPRQKWYSYQHIYIWPLYSLMVPRWQAFTDFADLHRGRIGQSPVRTPRVGQLIGIVVGKFIYTSWTIVIPMLVYPWWMVALAYGTITLSLSFLIAMTFQLAHCVEGTKFMPSTSSETVTHWAEHQVQSTANFSPSNSFITWILGGLNYQIEHHLFPWLPHTMYPRISPYVRAACLKHGINYKVFPTTTSAIRSHIRHVRNMARLGDHQYKTDLT